jgi:hypothetical protein
MDAPPSPHPSLDFNIISLCQWYITLCLLIFELQFLEYRFQLQVITFSALSRLRD